MTPTPPHDELTPPEGTRIRGRLRGLETIWTLDRFAEVIRTEVRKGVERDWSADRIRAWIRSAYDLDAQSISCASKAIDMALHPTDPTTFRSARETPRSSSQRQ